MPKKAPLHILKTPENIKVAVSEIDPPAVSAVIRGRRVPKSPKEPAISPSGFFLKVCTLCLNELAKSAIA